ncbi:Rad4-domain-containing protein [Ramaria rubella]|nr:Rad4-domain-containing protein [Ramaria rubella]
MQEGLSSPWNESTRNDDSSDEDEMDWEEVDVPTVHTPPVDNEAATLSITSQAGPSKSIEITLDAVKKKKPLEGKKTGMSHAERVMRLECHKIHTICLISNGWMRNKYLNDRLLHARLMSLTPLALQTAFGQIHKKREPDAKRRGRLFEAAIMRLSQWWVESFFDVEPRGSGEVQSQTFDEVAADLLRKKTPLKNSDHESGEVIRSCKSLQKHVLLRYGSRDLSAQLFTALCRALSVPARLVVSIQSVPWKASIGKSKSTYQSKKKGKQKVEGSDEAQSDMEEVEIATPLDGKRKAIFPGEGYSLSGTTSAAGTGEKSKPIIKLRKQRPQGRTLRAAKKKPEPPEGGYPPAQWTEVFSRADGRWLPVDPVRNYVDKCKLFEPPPHDKRNRMVYVLAFEEDGWARDVTQRYARQFTNKTSKIRVGGKGEKEWWDHVMSFLTRPYRLHRDDIEDEELMSRQIIEGMPSSVAAFKGHPIYVLEQHLLRDEILSPRLEVGRFRGEPVFARANVISGLKTAENWMRTGRVVVEGQQAMKFVKVRAVTIRRKRAIEIAGDDSHEANGQGESAMQGLYAESQTELYRPPPVTNGKVPKNDFGNIDLYVDTMLPSGGVHVPYKGVAKIARELGFDYAEAVIGFEFKNRRAFPVLNGVVVAVENESALLEAYWESAQDAEEKEQIKREERVLKRWTRLVQGLRIRKRLQEQYATQPSTQTQHHGLDNREDVPEPVAGGFLLETADKVVQAYTLPKPLHVIDPSSSNEDQIQDDPGIDAEVNHHSESNRGDAHTLEPDDNMEVVSEPMSQVVAPRTMQQLAEADMQRLAVMPIEQMPAEALIAKTGASTASGNGTAPATLVPQTKTRVTRGRKRTRASSGSEEAESDDRPRRGRTKTVPVSNASTPARTLRPRVPKSDEKKRRERELEIAYRRAIGE